MYKTDTHLPGHWTYISLMPACQSRDYWEIRDPSVMLGCWPCVIQLKQSTNNMRLG